MYISEKMLKECKRNIDNVCVCSIYERRHGKTLSSATHSYGHCSTEDVLALLFEIDMLRGVDPDRSNAKKMLDEIKSNPYWSKNVRRKFEEEFAKYVV